MKVPSTKRIETKQDSQTALLTTIANASLPDKETPHMLYRVNAGQSFTGASSGDPIIGILTINTVTNTFVSNAPLWYNGATRLPLVDADVDVSKMTLIAANSLTAAELSTMTLLISAVQFGEVQTNPTPYTVLARLKDLLTELQLKADLTDTQPVGVTARVCTGTQMITGLSSATPASLTVPALSVVAEIQADGGIVRIRRDAGTPTAATGWRIDDGMQLTVDSTLADVRLLAQSGSTTNVQIAYFDRA